MTNYDTAAWTDHALGLNGNEVLWLLVPGPLRLLLLRLVPVPLRMLFLHLLHLLKLLEL